MLGTCAAMMRNPRVRDALIIVVALLMWPTGYFVLGIGFLSIYEGQNSPAWYPAFTLAALLGIAAAWARVLLGGDKLKSSAKLRRATASGLALGLIATLPTFWAGVPASVASTIVLVVGAFLLAATIGERPGSTA